MIGSLIANLDHRGVDETLELLEKLRVKAAVAFGEVENAFQERRHYASISAAEPGFLEIKNEWWTRFNSVLSAVRDLPPDLTRSQLQKFIGDAAANWEAENNRAIKWVNTEFNNG